jgi:hypothetical protein
MPGQKNSTQVEIDSGKTAVKERSTATNPPVFGLDFKNLSAIQVWKEKMWGEI